MEGWLITYVQHDLQFILYIIMTRRLMRLEKGAQGFRGHGNYFSSVVIQTKYCNLQHVQQDEYIPPKVDNITLIFEDFREGARISHCPIAGGLPYFTPAVLALLC